MKNRLYNTLIVAALVLLALGTAAQAEILKCTFTGRGSGTLDGVAFAPTNFTITTFGDTLTRKAAVSVDSIVNIEAYIEFESLGVCTFTTPTRVFCNRDVGAVGFSRSGTSDSDLFDLFSLPGSQNWHMLTSFGPAGTSEGRIMQWDPQQHEAVNTSRGLLIFADNREVGSVFTAQIVPEPCSIAAVLMGLAGLGGFVIRKRR